MTSFFFIFEWTVTLYENNVSCPCVLQSLIFTFCIQHFKINWHKWLVSMMGIDKTFLLICLKCTFPDSDNIFLSPSPHVETHIFTEQAFFRMLLTSALTQMYEYTRVITCILIFNACASSRHPYRFCSRFVNSWMLSIPSVYICISFTSFICLNAALDSVYFRSLSLSLPFYLLSAQWAHEIVSGFQSQWISAVRGQQSSEASLTEPKGFVPMPRERPYSRRLYSLNAKEHQESEMKGMNRQKEREKGKHSWVAWEGRTVLFYTVCVLWIIQPREYFVSSSFF